MKLRLKQFFVRLTLGALRLLILVKRHGGPLLQMIGSPFRVVSRFLLRVFGVPLYRAFFYSKKQISRIVLPAKNKFVYFISNRYTIHAVMIAIAVMTSFVSLGSAEVRAETFGSTTLLYQMLNPDDAEQVEIVSAADFVEVAPTSYLDQPVLDPRAHIDLNYEGEGYVTPLVGGNALAEETAAPVQQRDETILYTIEEGDTLGGIAQKHGLSLSTVLWANDLTFRSTIQPGKELIILPIDGVKYQVKSGDTITKIAQKHGAESERIIGFNKLASADDIVIGEELMIPGGEKPSIAPRIIAPPSSLFAKPTTTTTAPKPRGSATGSGTWVWPTDWRVITQYYGWRHTGIDVDGDYSTRSYAASDGVVIYNGWRSGYGLTVEIDHGNGVTTRYAHHSKNYVAVGDVVTAGQIIAQTGTTGRSTGTHLHFEIIKNGKFQNPLDWVR